MRTRLLLLSVASLLAALLLSACTTTTLSGHWRDAGYLQKPNKILVIGVFPREIGRRIYESEFANRLSRRGVKALPSFSVLPEGQKWDKEQVAQLAEKEGVDAVLVTKFVDEKILRERRTEVIHDDPFWPHHHGPHYHPYYRSWYHDYSTSYVHVRSYDYEYRVVELETSLYDLTTEKVVWSAVSKTTSGSDSKQDVEGLVWVLIDRMGRDGLL